MNDAAVVEAVLFASDEPLTAAEIARADEALDEDRVEAALAALKVAYDDSGRAFELREVASGVQIATRPEFAPYLERFDTVAKPTRLSGPALEALAIVAYRQPISRIEIEYVRGVNSSGVVRTLLDRELIHVAGRGEGVGRPVLYATTRRFMEHFGFASLEDLPRPDELPVVLRERTPLADSGAAVDEPTEGGEGIAAREPDDPVAAVLAHAQGAAGDADADGNAHATEAIPSHGEATGDASDPPASSDGDGTGQAAALPSSSATSEEADGA